MLLGFDLYSRSSDMPLARREELRPPLASASAGSRLWTLNFYPAAAGVPAKDGTYDITKAVGATHSQRSWLSAVCALMLRVPPHGPLLCQMTVARFNELFRAARYAARVVYATPHQLRHGGASMDALPLVSDAEMLARGPWSSPSSLVRYRRPAKYLRAVAQLSPEQTAAALTARTRILAQMESMVKTIVMEVGGV